VDFNRQQATVTAVADQYDAKALVKALEKEGYQVKVVKEGGGS
jgi:hypothetical protein